MLLFIRNYLCNDTNFFHHEEWKILIHIITSGCHLAEPIRLFSVEIQESYCNQSLRITEGIYILLESLLYDESLSKIHVQFTSKMFLQSFLAIFRFLLMFLYKKKEIGPLVTNYFILKKIFLFIQFLI